MEKSGTTNPKIFYSIGMTKPKSLQFLILFCLLSLTAFTPTPPAPSAPEIGPAFPVAPHPTRMAWDGTSLWVISQGGKNVQQLDPETGDILFSYRGGDYPQDILVANEAIWFSLRDENMLQKIKLGDLNRFAYPASISPRGLAYDAENKIIWVACYGYGLLRQFDAVSGKRLLGISTGLLENPRLLAWDGKGLWVAGDQSLQHIDPVSGNIEDYQLPGYAYDMLWDGNYLWVTTALDYLLVRISPNGEQTTYRAGVRPFALAWDGQYIWVSDYTGGNVLQVSPVDGEIINRIELGYPPHDLLWADDRLWIADINGDAVQWIKPKM